MRQISLSIIVSSTVQGEGLYNRNYTWEGNGGGGLSGRYKAAMTVMVRLDPCQCFMQSQVTIYSNAHNKHIPIFGSPSGRHTFPMF